jgi:hypothetical protein
MKTALFTGSLADGITLIGPFDTPYDAVEYARNHVKGDWQLAPMHEPNIQLIAVPMFPWVIVKDDDDLDSGPLYWSNKDGWGSLDAATHFTEAEKTTYDLPMGGKWGRADTGKKESR